MWRTCHAFSFFILFDFLRLKIRGVIPASITSGFSLQKINNMKRDKMKDLVYRSTSTGFTQVPNQLLRNPEVSFKAKGLLALLLSNKDGWESTMQGLLSYTKEGKSAIQSALKELEEWGYLKRIEYRSTETKRYVGTLWAYTDICEGFDMYHIIIELDKYGYEPIQG